MAGSLKTFWRSLTDAEAWRSPRDAVAQMNMLQACYRHELLQASFARRNAGKMAYTMLPLKKKAARPAARHQPPRSLP